MSLPIDRQAIRRCNARHTRPITRLEIEFAANRYLGRHKESISERKSQRGSAERALAEIYPGISRTTGPRYPQDYTAFNISRWKRDIRF